MTERQHVQSSPEVPFYSNTPDDTHCYQAALRMVLKYFEPEKEFSWEELDTMTAKVKDLWTWPMAGMLWMQDNGYTVVLIEDFDYQAFTQEGEDYLIRQVGEEVAREQIAHSEIEQEKKYSAEMLEKIVVEKRVPQQADINGFLQDGYLVVCNVNSRKLNGKPGYVGHFIVITGTDSEDLVLHDPGLPPQKDRRIPMGTFEEAWAYPNESAKNIMAFTRTNT